MAEKVTVSSSTPNDTLQAAAINRAFNDPNLVTWDGPDDPDDPKNWPQIKKWTTILPMSLFNFLSSMSSATMAPALDAIQTDLQFPSNMMAVLSLSVFLLGTAFIPMLTAPLSEVFGRSIVLQSANLFYIVFNTLCGAAKTPNQLIVFRFFAGLGGAGPFAIGSGINADLFRPHERGRAIAVYTLAPLIGVVVGPIAGGFLVQFTSWRWCFYVVSIIGGVIQILGLPFFRETYAPVLLQRRCKRLRKSIQTSNLYTVHDNASLLQLLRTSIVRPFKLLATQPVIQVWSLYCAYLYGTLYLLIATFPNVWTDIYGESVSIGSLNYISFFVGMGLASQGGTRLADWYYRRLCAQNDGRSMPEFRLPVLVIGACIVPVGLFWYGWSARSSIHWIMPNIGAAIYGAGTVLEILCVMGYIIDTYQKYAASAMAAIICLRSILSFVLPLAAPSLYGNLGFGLGNTLLALIAICIGIPAPILLRYYGPALRKRSPYARDG
ncbi:putative MFS transporter [Aspergillus homomorphus CBS 101889]|uniref:Putative MFS transporter n=1 Tax=Aspergillus homomorphus (strain CBS 101889) TaxID=1450537 RepID=A0A395HLF4_ASPHC|nr:putative MFS transporter [Aspergillus homomorphus CBS 101889]RAL08761.1 putative MFS transporter [Aspergillus homomorphus CBS 101889]